MPYQYRKSPRAFWYEYNEGLYFITVCTWNKIHFFGRIYNNRMYLSKIGEFLDTELNHPHHHHPQVSIPHYIVMPNHFHAIVGINSPVGDCSDRMHKDISLKRLPMLSRYIGALKRATTKFANDSNLPFRWQSRFHDHIIRGQEEEYRIADYIDNNVKTWSNDCFNESSDHE